MYIFIKMIGPIIYRPTRRIDGVVAVSTCVLEGLQGRSQTFKNARATVGGGWPTPVQNVISFGDSRSLADWACLRGLKPPVPPPRDAFCYVWIWKYRKYNILYNGMHVC